MSRMKYSIVFQALGIETILWQFATRTNWWSNRWSLISHLKYNYLSWNSHDVYLNIYPVVNTFEFDIAYHVLKQNFKTDISIRSSVQKLKKKFMYPKCQTIWLIYSPLHLYNINHHSNLKILPLCCPIFFFKDFKTINKVKVLYTAII